MIDSSPLIAVLDDDDPDHERCLELLETYEGPLLVPTMCVCEISHLVNNRGGWEFEVRLMAAFALGEIYTEDPHPADFERMAELIETYRDLPLGTVDAAVVAAAERLEVTQIATLDRRHFSVVRPRHVEAFELLP